MRQVGYLQIMNDSVLWCVTLWCLRDICQCPERIRRLLSQCLPDCTLSRNNRQFYSSNSNAYTNFRTVFFGGEGEFCFWRKKIHLGLKEKLRIQAYFMETVESARDSFGATTGSCWCIGLRIEILLQRTSKNSFLQPNRSSVNVDIVIIHFTKKLPKTA